MTDNITAIDEQVRPLLATKRRLQVLEEDLKLERALAGRHHAYLQQLVLEVSGHPMPLPSGSATRQPTSDRTHRELHNLPPRTDQGHRSLARGGHGTVTCRSWEGHGAVSPARRSLTSTSSFADSEVADHLIETQFDILERGPPLAN